MPKKQLSTKKFMRNTKKGYKNNKKITSKALLCDQFV